MKYLNIPKDKFHINQTLTMTILTIRDDMEEHFGTFISITAFIQAPIIGMSFADYILVRKRRFSMKSAYFIKGHHAYDYNSGFNLIGLACVLIACVTTLLFVYNPITGQAESPIFLLTTGSRFDAILGGIPYFFASLVPSCRKYLLQDRSDLGIQ